MSPVLGWRRDDKRLIRNKVRCVFVCHACVRNTYLYDLFDQCFVGADLGPLQATHVLPDPGDQRELRPLAHGITRRDPHKTKQADII